MAKRGRKWHHYILRIFCFICLLRTLGNASVLVKRSVRSSHLTPEMLDAFREVCQLDPSKYAFCSEIEVEPTRTECKPLPSTTHSTELVNVTLDVLLAKGVAQINAAKATTYLPISQAIFMLGNSGSGKTTATQILVGDLSRLHATRTPGGTLVIIDDDGMIGAPTTKSKTIFPNYAQHPDNGLAFWDCPGFSDNRGPIVDIAAMYFLKYVLDLTTSAKFLFTVSHSSVKAGNDRNDFDLLATHAVRLLRRDFNELKDSIGLLVTKVGGFSQANGKRLSDKQILTEITDFLITYLTTKQEDLSTTLQVGERTELQSKIDFVQGILGEGNSTRIFFVQSPEDCGTLERMEPILESRRKITEKLSKTLKYSTVTKDYFRISLKAETLLQTKTEFIPKQVKLIEKNALKELQILRENFMENFYKRFHLDEKGSMENLTVVKTLLTPIASTTNSNFKPISVQLKKAQKTLAKKCPDANLLKELENQLGFFYMITSQNTTGTVTSAHTSWFQGFNSLLRRIGEMETFYNFCFDVEMELATYSKQVLFEGVKDDKIRDGEVLSFLHSSNLISIPTTILVLWQKLELADKLYLAELVRRSVPAIKVTCEETSSNKQKYRLIVSGRNVKLSNLLETSSLPGNCGHDESISEISVVGMERIYLDRNLDLKGKKLVLSLVAPIWQVILGNDLERQILLDGVQPPNLSDAKSGINLGDNGGNGASGDPGGSSGSFFGSYGIIENGEKLWISANGGKGGNGQNGGNGREGRNGSDATYNDFPNMLLDGLKGSSLEEGYFENGELITKDLVLIIYTNQWWSVRGKPGKPGGDGGSGGDGGLPGKPGVVEIVNTKGDNSSLIRTSNIFGEGGDEGQGGLGGKGGFQGDHHSCQHHNYLLFGNHWDRCYADKTKSSEYNGKPGSPGNDGQAGMLALTPLISTIGRTWQAINEYRTIFFGCKSRLMRTFTEELDSNPKILELLETISFATEIETLEEKFFTTKQIHGTSNRKLYQSYYDRFLQRLGGHVQSLQMRANPEESLLVVNVIYATVLGKLAGMKRAENRLNVIKTKDYFDALVTQLSDLKMASKEKAIEEESNNFKAMLQEKVKEFEYLLEGTVQPAIKNAHNLLESARGQLLQEVNEFLNATEKDVEKQKRLKSEYESARIRNVAMGVLGTLGAATSFLGPWGSLATQAISAGSSLTNSISPPKHAYSPQGYLELPDSFLNSVENVNTAYYQKKIELAEKKINLALETAQLVSDGALEDVSTKAEEAKSSLESLKESVVMNNFNLNMITIIQINEVEKRGNELSNQLQLKSAQFSTVTASRRKPAEVQVPNSALVLSSPARNAPKEEVDDEVDKVVDEVERVGEQKVGAVKVSPSNDNNDHSGQAEDEMGAAQKNEKRNAAIIKNAALAMKVANSLQDLVFNLVEGDEELSRLADMVKEAELRVQEVERKKQEYFDSFLPQLASIHEELRKETGRNPGQSQGALSVKKWKMTNLIKNMRDFIQQFTNGMEVEEQFREGFDALDQALTLMIDLYNQIERYEDEKELADFIANVNAAKGIKSKIKYGELRSTLVRLEFFVHANLFLEEYQGALHAFKQWVFPFASHYLSGSKRMENLSVPTSLEEVAQIYMKEVEGLSNELTKYKATTTNGDSSLVVATFTSQSRSSEPFYVWTNEKWQLLLKKLLAGEKIRLKADVQHTVDFFRHKSAIKYKSIEVTFKTQNGSRQTELNQKLNDFGMKMTHSGISLYRAMGQHFVMFDRNQSYRYSFERTANNQHVSRNMIKYKVDAPDADFLMSPYTWWTFQLTDAKHGSGFEFVDLSEFGEEVDLELEGEGVYFDEADASPNILADLNLADYYELYDPESISLVQNFEGGLDLGQSKCK